MPVTLPEYKAAFITAPAIAPGTERRSCPAPSTRPDQQLPQDEPALPATGRGSELRAQPYKIGPAAARRDPRRPRTAPPNLDGFARPLDQLVPLGDGAAIASHLATLPCSLPDGTQTSGWGLPAEDFRSTPKPSQRPPTNQQQKAELTAGRPQSAAPRPAGGAVAPLCARSRFPSLSCALLFYLREEIWAEHKFGEFAATPDVPPPTQPLPRFCTGI